MQHPSYQRGDELSEFLDVTIGEYFDQVVDRFPDREAIVVRHQNIRRTYRQYQRDIHRLAFGLLSLGIKKGDRVGIWGPNSYEWCLTQMATAKIGAILVCINPAYRLHELEFALNKVQCKAIVCADAFKNSDYTGMLKSLAPELGHCSGGQLKADRLPSLELVIKMGNQPEPGMLNFWSICHAGETDSSKPGQWAHELPQHIDTGLRLIADELSADDPINIQFTSGTTGKPKGATLTHKNILNNAWFTGQYLGFSEQDRLCVPVPLYHCFGLVLSSLTCMVHGAAAVYPNDAFEPVSVLQTVEEESCTALHGVPTMFIAELELESFREYDLSSLRTGIMAGAPCPIEVMNRVIEEMHMKHILIGYGQTELSPINHMTRPQDPIEKRVETVGQAVPGLEVKLIDDSGNIVPRGERGEVCTRGYSVMQGYWGDEQATLETIDAQGWLHSGDIGIMDDEGYVSIVGRSKDLIIRGGENIYPREIEEFLHGHPQVLDVQVFGIPDQRFGERVCAWIQLQTGADVSEQDIKLYCRDQITHFKIPALIRFVESFPMTITGKAQKFKMRELEIERCSAS
ncbi:AMP-binding protein [Pseudomaricurvus alkylphenolicus]|uniref:AMP-binding protein n=1 Tax=Pseudomaricurvus alkylphenolicus TaxID=1306991 RepID=UPI001421DA9F|nr:AMP-binding protein [Pseudomaricurvus alkylphenolicus]NIB38636.1 AMP-binding protein [Pseudomaricurvus alkylphenolicus]